MRNISYQGLVQKVIMYFTFLLLPPFIVLLSGEYVVNSYIRKFKKAQWRIF